MTRRRGDAEEEAENSIGKSKPESAESAEILGLRGEAYVAIEGIERRAQRADVRASLGLAS